LTYFSTSMTKPCSSGFATLRFTSSTDVCIITKL
jgi:hypothetical protein